jgi:hypothetical protein
VNQETDSTIVLLPRKVLIKGSVVVAAKLLFVVIIS